MMEAKHKVRICVLLGFLVMMPAFVASSPLEKPDKTETEDVNANKIIPTSTEKLTENTTSTTAELSPDDLEKSHSELVEKVAGGKAGEGSKDEKLGTADNFPIGFASPNGIAYDAPLLSGAYGGIGGRPNAGLNNPYLGYQGQGFPSEQYFGGQGGAGFVGNPLVGGDYSGVKYGGYGNQQLYGAGQLGGLGQQPFLNKQSGFGSGAYGGIRQELQKSIKSIDNAYGGLPYGGYGQDAELGYAGDYPLQALLNKGAGIGAYGNLESGLHQKFGGSQYPINLNTGGLQPYQDSGFGLGGYQQQLGGYAGQRAFGQYDPTGFGYSGQGQLGVLAQQQQALLARGKGGLGSGYQASPYYNGQLDPVYRQTYNSFQPTGTNKFYQGKSPYGFYRNG